MDSILIAISYLIIAIICFVIYAELNNTILLVLGIISSLIVVIDLIRIGINYGIKGNDPS